MIKTNLINRRALCASFSMLVLCFAAPAVLAKDGGETTRVRTPLTGASLNGQTPNGHAEFRVESGRNRTKLNVEVEDVNLAEGTTLTVMVDHAGARTKAGEIKLDALRSGELELNSEDGDVVPTVHKGDIVIVVNAGVAILTGVF